MLIAYGFTTIEIASSRPKEVQCYNCEKIGQVNISKQVTTLFLILPLFPIKINTEFNCVHCNHSIFYNEMDHDLKEYFKPFKIKKRPALWNFSGIIVTLIILIVFQFNHIKKKEIVKERLDTLKLNRIIAIKTEEGKYTTYKICKIDGKQIKFIYNSYEVENQKGLERIEYDYYSNDTAIIDKSTLYEWLQDDKILDIYW
jgi:hypothetical protein